MLLDMKWRDSGLSNSKEEPTALSHVCCSIDVIQRHGDYELVILHVRAWRGKGFMAMVRSTGTSQSGTVFLGEDEEAYGQALGQGIVMYSKRKKD